jgi:hypothetical protein
MVSFSHPNEPIERPNIEVPRYVIEDLYKTRKVNDSIRQLFGDLMSR